jgi:hypothetical protein
MGSPLLITNLILASGLWKHHLESEKSPKALQGIISLNEIATKDAEQLQALGINGIVRSPQEGLLTFPAWRAKIAVQIQRKSAQAKLPNGS